MRKYNGKEVVGSYRGKIVIYCPRHRQYEVVGLYHHNGERISPPTNKIRFQ